ncbi:hypothetical protein BDV93DRAFT_556806 [Ceratobasidium sp. AG-I]|nr:hypothetical protein BDV93DRAFT_556806 [Ceratobasidium sp. AG-I]
MKTLEQGTGVPKTYLVAGVVGLMTLLVTVNTLAAPASSLIGWGLPALKYWDISGFLTHLESFALRITFH